MNKNKSISVKFLNRAMKSSNQRAIRTNKALGLDTVYVRGYSIVREHADGRTTTIQKVDNKSSIAKTLNGPLKLG